MIGIAFVDISSLYLRNSAEASAMISGYYHVVDRNVIRNSMQMTSIDSTAMGNLSQGQLKVTIMPSRDLKTQKNPFQHSETFGPGDSPDFGVSQSVSQTLPSSLPPPENALIS